MTSRVIVPDPEIMSFSSFVSIGPVNIGTGVSRFLNSNTVHGAINNGDIAPTSGLIWDANGLKVVTAGYYVVQCQVSFVIVKPVSDQFVQIFLEFNDPSSMKLKNEALVFRNGNTEECINFSQIKYLVPNVQYTFKFRCGNAPNSQYFIDNHACSISVHSIQLNP
jgi:hypothetical protein